MKKFSVFFFEHDKSNRPEWKKDLFSALAAVWVVCDALKRINMDALLKDWNKNTNFNTTLLQLIENTKISLNKWGKVTCTVSNRLTATNHLKNMKHEKKVVLTLNSNTYGTKSTKWRANFATKWCTIAEEIVCFFKTWIQSNIICKKVW